MQRIVIAGTDTSVGKTILSALFMSSIESLYYWKPVQSGLEDETDPETVRRLSECSSNRIIAEVYKLQQPLSPHLSARLDGITIDENKLGLPAERDLIIEAAGGVLVPMNDNVLQVDVIAMWQIPVVIATRSSLGTINHTLLTLEALRKRNIEVAGCVTIGEINSQNETAIATHGKTKILGRIPLLGRIDKTILKQVYDEHFNTFRQHILKNS